MRINTVLTTKIEAPEILFISRNTGIYYTATEDGKIDLYNPINPPDLSNYDLTGENVSFTIYQLKS